MIAQRNLSLLSNRLAKKGERRIPENVLERDYCLAWFLVGLSRCLLGQSLVFKGGTALKRCYFEDYRFSEDLDFTLSQKIDFAFIQNELEPVFTETHQSSGVKFRYSRDDRHAHVNSYTFYMGYEGPLPVTVSGKEVKVDITLQEKIVFPIQNQSIIRGYPEFTDIPNGAQIQVYSLKEIAAEKTLALMDRARTEPRDLFDMWYLVQGDHISMNELVPAVKEKLDFRGKKATDVLGEFQSKEPRLRKLWEARLSPQMTTLPPFDDVFRSVRRAFRQAGLS